MIEISRTVAIALTVIVLVGTGVSIAAIESSDTANSVRDHNSHNHNQKSLGTGTQEMRMQMVENGTIVNENKNELPPGCDEIAFDRKVTVVGGTEHAETGEMFSFKRDRIQFEQCTRVTITFINRDDVRHQWMVHGLPTETYPMGMFNIEVNGPAQISATFITPGRDDTLHTHCSLPQHEQKGMEMFVDIGEGGNQPVCDIAPPSGLGLNRHYSACEAPVPA